jgi:chromosome segregation ATPase
VANMEELQTLIRELSGKIDNIDSKLDRSVADINNRMTVLERNQNATRDDISGLRNRVDSIDGTVRIAIADGFRQHDRYLDGLNTDLAQVERQSRRINRRVERLERLEGEGA